MKGNKYEENNSNQVRYVIAGPDDADYFTPDCSNSWDDFLNPEYNS